MKKAVILLFVIVLFLSGCQSDQKPTENPEPSKPVEKEPTTTGNEKEKEPSEPIVVEPDKGNEISNLEQFEYPVVKAEDPEITWIKKKTDLLNDLEPNVTSRNISINYNENQTKDKKPNMIFNVYHFFQKQTEALGLTEDAHHNEVRYAYEAPVDKPELIPEEELMSKIKDPLELIAKIFNISYSRIDQAIRSSRTTLDEFYKYDSLRFRGDPTKTDDDIPLFMSVLGSINRYGSENDPVENPFEANKKPVKFEQGDPLREEMMVRFHMKPSKNNQLEDTYNLVSHLKNEIDQSKKYNVLSDFIILHMYEDAVGIKIDLLQDENNLEQYRAVYTLEFDGSLKIGKEIDTKNFGKYFDYFIKILPPLTNTSKQIEELKQLFIKSVGQKEKIEKNFGEGQKYDLTFTSKQLGNLYKVTYSAVVDKTDKVISK